MISDERMRVYLSSLDPGNVPYLEEIADSASSSWVPIIRRDTQAFLRTFLKIKRPRTILEVGTAVGFSALLFCEYGPEDLSVTTIENDPARIEAAKQNFEKAGRDRQITLKAGDAGEILKTLEGPYDLIFMDAAKGQYIHWLPDTLRLLPPGGVLLSDNVLQEGEILESHFLVERRKRTIHKRMREYLFQITHDPSLTTTILTVGDGLALSVKNDEKNT